MATPQFNIVALSDLGKGLIQNPITELIDTALSTDANNSIVFGNDNGLFVDITGKFDNPTGNITDYIAGDGSIQLFPPVDIATKVVATVRNQTGGTIPAGSVVYITGAAGNKAVVSLASNSSEITSSNTYGVLQADIANNSNGIVVITGQVAGLDTSAFTEGATLWLGMIPGTYTSTKPQAPAHLVRVGVVTRSHHNQGSIDVTIQNGFEIEELHNVLINGVANNDVLVYDSTQHLWINSSILNSKVDKVSGKQLSTEDFTTAFKDKVNSLHNVAVTYGGVLPIAPGNTGDIYFLTSDGTANGTLLQEFIYDGSGWSWREIPQVKSDWEQTDSSQKSFIQNKPTLGSVALTNSYVDLLNKPVIPDAQIQSDWNQANTATFDYIKNKPVIPTLVNADWNSTTGFAQILNKPVIPDAQVNSDWNSNSGISQILNRPDLTQYVLNSSIGASNGVVPLNALGKIDNSYINFTGATYKGTWNVSSNTPSLADGVGVNADFYYVEVAGTRDLGDGSIQFYVGDLVIYDTATGRWRRVGGNGVTTVNGVSGVVTLTTDQIPESANLYFTSSRVLSTALSNISTANSAVITSTDSVISGMGKLQAQFNAITAAKLTITQRDTLDSSYVYYGGTLGTGAWQVNRWEISTNTKTIATMLNNSSVTSLTAAWASRTTLTYA